MALNVFPTTPTLAWSVIKAPNWGTRMQRSVSGRELRVSDYLLPVYTFTLTYEVLRDKWDTRAGAGVGFGAWPTLHDELRQIWSFFNQQKGAAIPFAFHDPTDNTTRSNPAVAQTFNFAIGDGLTLDFQMASPLLAPVVTGVITSVSVNGVIQPGTNYYYNGDKELLSFVTAPAAGATIGADFTYNYKVRFAADGLEAENFMYQLWSVKQMKFVSVIG